MTYNDDYYLRFQKPIGEFGAKFHFKEYRKHISLNDVILDFGCGGGFLLEALKAKEKYGVEINPFLIKILNAKNIKCYKDVSELENNSIDVIIMHSVIGHLENPIETLKELKLKLKKDEKKLIYLINDGYKFDLINDVNKIYFSFSPRNIRNISTSLDFKIELKKTIIAKWPPYYLIFYKYFGLSFVKLVAKFYGIMTSIKFTQGFYVLRNK